MFLILWGINCMRHESVIREVSRSDWQMQDDGLTEQFVAVGQGKQGFHYAVFTSYRGGDDYRWSEGHPWSEQAFPSESAAREAAHAEVRQIDYENAYEPEESPEQQPATALSGSDGRARAAYEEYCKIHQSPPTEAGRNEWVREWRGLAEEQRQDAVDMERGHAPQWPKAEAREHDGERDLDPER